MDGNVWKSPVLILALMVAVLLSSVVSQVAAVGPAGPHRQGGSETEPNDTPAQANLIAINESLVGLVPASNPSDIDYFKLGTEIGRRYEVRLDESPASTDYRFNLSLYDGGENLVDEDETAGGDAALTWTANATVYYFGVEAVEIGDEDAPYEIRVIRFVATPTPPDWDDCEVNDTLTGSWSQSVPPGGPCPISVGATTADLNFVPYTGQGSPNPDYFLVSVKAGRRYRLEAKVAAGVDTVVYLYAPGTTDDSQYIDTNDDAPGLGLGSRLEWSPSSDGAYLIRVENREPLPHETDETYTLSVQDISPTATPTHTPVATGTPGTPTATTPPLSIPGKPDAFEPNYDFNRATLIGLDAKYAGNFVPWSGVNVDNDFYKLWVVAGKLYTCETLELGTATNTNMILYSGPSHEQGFAGNDDVQPFDPSDPYRSRITFFSSYNGYVYILLGQVGAERILPEEWANLTYSLRCFIDQPSTATPTPTSPYVPPPQSTSTPVPTSTPGQVVSGPTSTPEQVVPLPTAAQLVVLPMTTPIPPPLSTPVAAVPTPESYVIEMLLYYDRNANAQMDPGEGILDVLARAYDAVSGDLLSVDYSDETGRLGFTVSANGPVRVSVPFFGFDQIVTATRTSIRIRISPHP